MDKINELDKLYKLGDEGYIKIYCDNYKKTIKCISKKDSMYHMYNEKSKLWELKTDHDIVMHFISNMKKIIKPLCDHYKNIAEKVKDTDKAEYEKNIETYETILKTGEFYKVAKAKILLLGIKSGLYDINFQEKLNNNPYMLPVKNGLINLKTGDYKERTHEDMFSFELDV